MSRRWVVPLVLAVLGLQQCCIAAESASPLQFRGYYMTFMRMPVMGLPEWKEMIDCIQEDGGNMLLLWMGGGFQSKKFPITWKYNHDHKNVQRDFARKLIDYAHTREIKVLLAFTPFGYDGVKGRWQSCRCVRHSLLGLEHMSEPACLAGVHARVRARDGF